MSLDDASHRQTGFLHLPPEIRNQVYDLATEVHPPKFPGRFPLKKNPRPVVVLPRTTSDTAKTIARAVVKEARALLRDPKREHLKNITSIIRDRHQGTNKKQPTRMFFSLTQVSRVVRYEYRPLYLKRTKFSICFSDLLDYTEDFLQNTGSEQPAIGDLRVDNEMACGDRIVVDLFPFLQLYRKSPDLHIEFDFFWPYSFPGYGGDSLFSIRDGSRWASYFALAVSGVLVICGSDPGYFNWKPRVLVTVQPEYREHWMMYERHRQISGLRRWSDKSGLYGPWLWVACGYTLPPDYSNLLKCLGEDLDRIDNRGQKLRFLLK
ncbi:hypothetical protein K458DRAFT_436194 [Lentithecium fluviatile CBS 122367]|uniref:Uncharacterized protein n=1 Tax=Lentithecium fluviatile CBS 122367 TaxID=1168545 RepID=A0A6G1IJ06_9PLEO|nr:hypothetical protein K458DRAFT_436194 [Lentithecium fluviatile CBS 122367]